SQSGCDSIVTTHLSVSDILTSEESVSICLGESYILPDGTEVSAEGSYESNLISQSGCDSIVTTHLSVSDILTSEESVSICLGESYILPDGAEVSAAGPYALPIISQSGCDSIVTTHLSVSDILTSEESVSICL